MDPDANENTNNTRIITCSVNILFILRFGVLNAMRVRVD